MSRCRERHSWLTLLSAPYLRQAHNSIFVWQNLPLGVRTRGHTEGCMPILAEHARPPCPPGQSNDRESCQFLKIISCFLCCWSCPLACVIFKRPSGCSKLSILRFSMQQKCSMTPPNILLPNLVVDARPRRRDRCRAKPTNVTNLAAGLCHGTTNGHNGYDYTQKPGHLGARSRPGKTPETHA